MKKILLIGDSIRLSYEKYVKESLKESAIIHSPGENCRFSLYTLFNLSSWSPDNDYDVIHWNNGQWDTCYMPDGKIHTPLETYLETQKRIHDILKQKSKKLVFATTTPVWDEMEKEISINYRKNQDIINYNSAVVEMLKENGVPINDLFSPIYNDIKRYICDDMVHMNEEGQRLLADHVSKAIS